MNYLPSNETKNLKTVPKKESKLMEEMAKQFSVTSRTIKNYISLLKLPQELQNLM